MKFYLQKYFIVLFLISFCLSGTTSIVVAQSIFPKDYFAPPLKNSFIVLSNFGDLRANHFHSGIDLRTGDGTSLFSVADGYVSRIKVSPVGYGKALYITHPNGYTSVYAHLKKYNSKLEEYIKKMQYENHDFAVELFPKPDELEICKGEFIGLSGNTGLSSGAHLHFEIRNTESEHILNPLLFYNYKDDIAPVITRVHIYPLDKHSMVNGKNSRQSFDIKSVKGKKGNQTLIIPGNIALAGRIGFGIEAYDLDNISNDKSNIYSIEIHVDSSEIYFCKFEEFSFDNKRDVNSYIDFKEYYTNSRYIQRCFVAPNNKTQIYSNLKNQGVFDFNADALYTISIKLKDVRDNTTKLAFKAQGSKRAKEFKEEKDEYTKTMPYEEVNYFLREDIKISFPEDVFYDTLFFHYSNSKAGKGFYSAIHHIHNKLTPISKNVVISIKTDQVPLRLLNKILIATVSKNGSLSSIGGQLKDNYLTAETFEFGSFAIVADTIPPELKPLNIFPWEDLRNGKTIRFKVSDNLSGIKKFSGYIDGQWVLFEFDKKTEIIIFTFDDFPITGDLHSAEVCVEDEVGNSSSVCVPFYR